MDIQLHPPLSFCHIGGRDNVEDYISPPLGKATPADRLFIVCDGVGGHSQGEIASQITADTLAALFQHQSQPLQPEQISKGLDQVRQRLQAYREQHPDAANMSTTLAILHLHQQGATTVHLGDSRIYHLRGGQVLWRSDDHTVVNDMVRGGILTPEEATTHPQRNVISRYVHPTNKHRPDIHHITDLQPGDYFLLCTDGLLEQNTDHHIAALSEQSSGTSDVDKLHQLWERSHGRTGDNFSAYLIHIAKVNGIAHPEPDSTLVAEVLSGTTIAPTSLPAPTPRPPVTTLQPTLRYLILIAALLTVALAAYLVANRIPSSTRHAPPPPTPDTPKTAPVTDPTPSIPFRPVRPNPPSPTPQPPSPSAAPKPEQNTSGTPTADGKPESTPPVRRPPANSPQHISDLSNIVKPKPNTPPTTTTQNEGQSTPPPKNKADQ